MPRKKKHYIISVIILIIALGFGITVGAIAWIVKDTPDISNYKGSSESTLIYSADGELLTKLFKENRIYVPLERIPKELKTAIIAIEDTSFYVHHGVDFWGIARALVTNIMQGGTVQGASTITMQLAENALFARQERTYYRKIQELYLALQFERLYTKPEILEMYLNEIFMGHSAYGVETAAQQYFNKHVWELNLSESALIAGLPKAPNYYSPINNIEAAQRRRNVVLNRMLELGYITQQEAQKTKKQEIKIDSSSPSHQEDIAPYFIRYVRDKLIDRFGAQMVYNGGLKVYTTLDIDMQKKAEETVNNAIGKYIPTVERKNVSDKNQPQMSLITINPNNGAIRAMIGGRGDDQFNRATQAVRQPGSAFKPFVYTTAIKNGHSPGTIINDMPMLAERKENQSAKIWPKNYDEKYRGYVTTRDALKRSINVAAVKKIQKVSVNSTMQTATEMGISTLKTEDNTEDHLAMALGGLTRGVKSIDITSAYGIFANNGIRVEPHAISRVLDNRNQELYTAHPNKEIVLAEDVSYLMTDMLQTVVKEGTGWRVQRYLNRPVAGKTGTTNNYTDGWFVGFTPDLVTSVWIGEDNPTPMKYDPSTMSASIKGGEIESAEAVQLWSEYMQKVVKGRPKKNFNVPENIVQRKIDPITGLLASEETPNPEIEVFRKGNIPEKYDDLHGPTESVRIDTESGMLATANCPESSVKKIRYIAQTGIRIGPETIKFTNKDELQKNGNREISQNDIISGTYIVSEGEPVQKIDPQSGVPIKGNDGEVIYHSRPTRKCNIHGGDDSNLMNNIWNFFKGNDE